MIRIAVNQIDKYYGANQVLKGLTLEIFEGEKIGVLGPNGAGKSTLMRVMMQEEPFEKGDLFITKGARLGALSQIPSFDEAMTVKSCLRTAFKDLLELKVQIDRLECKMIETDGQASLDQPQTDQVLLKKYGELVHLYEHGGGYEIEDRIEDIAKAFNFNADMLCQKFEKLSGGEKTRVGLATLLLKPLDVIFLDEPTNHLDLNTIEWLEAFIKKFKGTVVIISHDRYFLNQTVDRVVEVNFGQATSYKGNYDDYTREKALLLKQMEENYAQEQKKIKQLEDAAKRMHDWAERADSPAMHRRAFSIEKRIERMDKTEHLVEDKRMSDTFESEKSVSKEVLRFFDLSKAYGDKTLIQDQTATVFRDQKIALLGNNGAGKSTLIKILLGLESPDQGQLTWSPSAIIGYLPQEINFEFPEMTVLEWIKDALTLEEGNARNLLARYKFKQEDVFKVLGGLSGGERTRLKLCELMSNKVNVLLLDEPTNHLDISSREWVEDAIATYRGTMIFISHDRHFIEKFSNKFWHLQGGNLFEFEGTYAAYKKFCETALPSLDDTRKTDAKEKETVIVGEGSVDKELEKTKKNNVKIQMIETEIGLLENRLDEIAIEMDRAGTAYEMLEMLIAEKETVLKTLESQYEQWEKYNG